MPPATSEGYPPNGMVAPSLTNEIPAAHADIDSDGAPVVNVGTKDFTIRFHLSSCRRLHRHLMLIQNPVHGQMSEHCIGPQPFESRVCCIREERDTTDDSSIVHHNDPGLDRQHTPERVSPFDGNLAN